MSDASPGDMIVMSKDDCILCNGSGWVMPYPYRRRKKCSHTWNRGSFMERYYSAKDAISSAEHEMELLRSALRTEIREEA